MKKLCSLVLSVLLLAGTTLGGAAFGETMDYSNHEEFSFWTFSTPSEYYASYADNPVVKYLNEKFNVTLAYEQPVSGTEADSLGLMFGTGQYTDVINVATYTGSVKQLYEDGVIIDLAEYLDYMPNLKQRIDADEGLKRHLFDDDGHMFELPEVADEAEAVWGGLVYRRDILETMTGGNVQFPSGNDDPTTVEDWDYMLPLLKAYFEAAGMQDYAVLIIPYYGYCPYGELMSGFGFTGSDYYVKDGQVRHGYMDDGFYDYLKKMNEWYEAGYIYQDFVSRVNDMFYLPNTSLTYGGAAGIWYGLSGQIGTSMSMPEYGLEMDVRPVASPLNGDITAKDMLPRVQATYEASGKGSVVTTACTNVPKLLSILDYMYSDEGGMLRKYGLTKEQIPSGDTLFAKYGLEDGAYWFEGDTLVINPLFDLVGGTLQQGDLTGTRIPGYTINSYARHAFGETTELGDRVWRQYDDAAGLEWIPASLSYSTEDDKVVTTADINIQEYAHSAIPGFIMGTEEITQESFAAFKDQLNSYGMQECIEINQAAYERYLAR
ncbi:MAG: extracellular solute-binding protein [Clostridiales bacterium]|nr:extracellular solute-binding protein [Clostridiales bacterium]